jgi:hypothetical protein
MSCASFGCKLARPGTDLNPLCYAACRIEEREKKPPAPPPEPAITPEQVAAEDSLFGVLLGKAEPC